MATITDTELIDLARTTIEEELALDLSNPEYHCENIASELSLREIKLIDTDTFNAMWVDFKIQDSGLVLLAALADGRQVVWDGSEPDTVKIALTTGGSS